MNFRPELAEKIMAGEKTVTRRLMSPNPRSPWFDGGCSLKVGQTYAVCPGRGKNAIGRVRIVAVMSEPLGHLIEREAVAEGFDDVEDFIEAWTEINGRYDPDAIVWRVSFEVDQTALRVVHGWNTQCGACGYGGTSWVDSPALQGKPIITPESESCPECGARFDGNDDRYATVYPSKDDAPSETAA
jgi:uncharacterized protein YhfF